jgi:hypothetical protein
VIEAAEKGNYEPLKFALKVLESPYEDFGKEGEEIFKLNEISYCVSCSS